MSSNVFNFSIPSLQDKIAENQQTYIDTNKRLQFPIQSSSDKLNNAVYSQFNSEEDINNLKEQRYQFKTRFKTYGINKMENVLYQV